MDILDDLLVISLEQAVAAPFVSSRLADAGARVIKIERPEGDFARHYDDVVKSQSAYFYAKSRKRIYHNRSSATFRDQTDGINTGEG